MIGRARMRLVTWVGREESMASLDKDKDKVSEIADKRM